MKRRAIGTVILLAALSVIGVVLTQVLWLDRAFKVQREEAELVKERDDQLAKQFNDRVTIALTNVTEQILTLSKDPSDLYDAVKQERPNYFAVTINDTVHPYLLEALLRKEFQRRNIQEDFEYGIYDCFTDSIVYGNYVALADSTSESDEVEPSRLLKLNKDGHYFGVFFPRRSVAAWHDPVPDPQTWIYPAMLLMIVFSFLAYSVWVIMNQKRLSEMKNDFIGNMTHELKTPISTIALSSEVLMTAGIENEPERLNRYAQIIHKENERLRNQVERVLQLSTLDKDGPKLKREPVDMHEVIQDVLQAFKVSLEERKGDMTTHLNAPDPTVLGDPVHLKNVMMNLVDNAMKYCPGIPAIAMRTAQVNGKLTIEVQDNGIGIDQSDQAHIFKRFYRVHTGNVHDVKGFGLGLHYVDEMVRSHHGSIKVRSAKGKGSTFIITLPTRKN